jgi:hypothetical protein
MDSYAETTFLQIQSYSEHPEVYRMADLIVDSYLKGKARCHRRKYVRAARKLVASLWGHSSSFFRFSTSAEHYGAKRKQVWMSRVVLTLFRHMRDMDPPMFNLVEAAIPPALAYDGKGKSAVYCKSWFFTNTLKELTELDIVPDPDLPRISLKSEDDIWLPIPAEEKQAAWYTETDRILRAHSEMLYKANIRLSDGSSMPPGDWYYYRRFKGSLRVTGRLYSAFQNYPKVDRLGVTFDGVAAASIDFTALHPLLLLRIFHRLDREPHRLFFQMADPYDMPWYPSLPRPVHKRLINTLLNAKSRDSAIRAFLNTYYWYDALKDEVAVEVYRSRKKRRGIKAFRGNKPEIERYIEIFCLHHPMFREHLFKGAGNALQYLDSEVMLALLNLSLRAKIPVLPVHDEVVFPEPYMSDVRGFLIAAWQQVLHDAGRFGNLPIKTKVIKKEAVLEIVDSLCLGISGAITEDVIP